MPDISFIHPDGSEQGFEAPEGVSVMQAATGFGVAGIVAECGGSALCATCHVYVDAAWVDQLPPPLANELEMLDCTAAERRPGSRLSCQITLNAAMQGLVLHLPERQQ
ncbi:2Fe-2S iron-sulfur cluster-binding protein [Aquabacterium sp.]|uniref:2Fe-2S iron-sulfur cluster-binding protein n=1 Tax=Aquabacterium sp. TaxID=1872578 RepID=UPI002BC65B9D|nr:2Fe-2S iron-sulfur cluster-binding protein [Aquabacterium sp.]HSW07937.1 2Fe-2S iron-sulfur cluster-binding protein [Aquabacterium sp.]